MKLKAKHWVNYQGNWHMAGDVFRIDADDAEEMKAYGDLVDEDEPARNEEAEATVPAKRGRKRKADE